MPFSAPLPVPTMIAVGVARPMAHGQAMMRTAIALVSAYVSFGSGPKTIQAAKVSAAMTITAGTNQPVTRSATRWIGAFEPCARSTSVTIWASVVSRPMRSARNTKEPLVLIVAPMALSPTRFSTGSDSPVSIDSSTADAPVDEHAVDRYAVAGPDADEVADDDLVDRDLALAALAQDAGRVRSAA